MAITITGIDRPQNCGHMTVTVSADGQSRVVTAHIDDVTRAAETAGMPEAALMTLLWIWYRRQKGETFASMIGKVVA